MTFAQFVGGGPFGNTGIIGALNVVVIPIIFALVFLFFIWGVVKYFFLDAESESGREEGRQFILWGVLGMALLFSIWGVLHLLLSTLGIG